MQQQEEASVAYDPFDTINPMHLMDVNAQIFSPFFAYGADASRANLGMGYSDEPMPDIFKQSLLEALDEPKAHQYCRFAGPAGLANEVALKYSDSFHRKINPIDEVLISFGASQCFANFLTAFTTPGDEVVTFEPSFVIFNVLMINMGLKVKTINLLSDRKASASDHHVLQDAVSCFYSFDRNKFQEAFTKNTKVLLLNNPHNPTGKVFNKEELEWIADFLKHNHPQVVVLSDAAYCDLVYDKKEFIQIGSLPDMWSRTVTIFSFGKTFGPTGWRLGFAVGPKKIMAAMISVHTNTVACVVTPIALAAEKVMKKARTEEFRGFPNYYAWMANSFESKRDRIVQLLTSSPLKFEVVKPEGGYFLLAKIDKAIENMPVRYFYADFAKNDYNNEKLKTFDDWETLHGKVIHSPDFAFCHYMAIEWKIVVIPLSAYTSSLMRTPREKEQIGTRYVRVSICKSNSSIELLEKRLMQHEQM